MAGEPEAEVGGDEALDYEAALVALDQVLAGLEDGKASLEESIALYERGVRLVRRCSELLSGAERRINELSQSPDGTLVEKAFQLPADEESPGRPG